MDLFYDSIVVHLKKFENWVFNIKLELMGLWERMAELWFKIEQKQEHAAHLSPSCWSSL